MCEEKNATKRNVNMETLPKCESSPSEILCVDPDGFSVIAIILF